MIETGPLVALRMTVFVIGALYFVWVSRRALRNPRCHGFYRFFAFVGILALVLLNAPYWQLDMFAPRQLLSWACLLASIAYIVLGLRALRRIGGQRERANARENFAFENTEQLVTVGLFRWVRHPMYGALMLLAWGAFLKHIDPVSIGLVLAISGFLAATAMIEERENIAFFGDDYRTYMRSSKMFLPFLL